MIVPTDFFIQGAQCTACSDASASSPASISLMVLAVVLVMAIVLRQCSEAFRKVLKRVPWRSVIVKSKIMVIFFQVRRNRAR